MDGPRFDLGEERNRAIAARLLGEPNRRLSTWRELRFGNRGSLAVIPSRGTWFDNEAGLGGGMLDLVVHAGAATDRRAAAQLLREDGDLPERETRDERQARADAEARQRAERMAAAAELWGSGRPIAGSAAEAYLRHARRIDAPLGDAALRFLIEAPLRPYAPDGRIAPALAARVVDGSGAPIGLHLTYLRADGAGKACVATPRKMIGLIGGGHVRLSSGATLVVGEGLESALSAWSAAASELGAAGLGASAALSAGGVAAFVWPKEARRLVIAPDRDPNGAGERAARELSRRAIAAGLTVDLLWPPEGLSDWNAAATA